MILKWNTTSRCVNVVAVKCSSFIHLLVFKVRSAYTKGSGILQHLNTLQTILLAVFCWDNCSLNFPYTLRNCIKSVYCGAY